ncbi:MAG TPA: hypothetical protein VHT34_11635 [Clostridia bacterium]|nr:hypothetical protein [Clostridia bacterium]
MGGFFGFFDYSKPGIGISKDEPKKTGIFLFFELYFRKFWNLMKLNLLFSIFNIPALVISFIATGFYFNSSFSKDPAQEFGMRILFTCMFLGLTLITTGPAQAGMTYILRNFVKEEPSFLWWDFRDTAKSNFKQSSIICLIDIFFTSMFGISINLYNHLSNTYHYMFIFIPMVLLAFIIFVIMHLYIYPMLVTFELTIKQIYKNAFLFAISKLLPNLGIVILCLLVVWLSFSYWVIGLILFPLITTSTVGFIVNFYVNPILKKYMMDEPDEEGTEEA